MDATMQSAMMDSMLPPQSEVLVTLEKALLNLSQKPSVRIRTHDGSRMCPREGTPTTDEIKKISPDITGLRNIPHPNFQEALAIASQINQTLQRLRSSVFTIGLAEPQVSSKNDQNLGILKRYRTDRLLNDDSMEEESSIANRKDILIATTEASEMINDIIQWSQKSNVCCLQHRWQISLNGPEYPAAGFIQHLDLVIQLASERQSTFEADPGELSQILRTPQGINFVKTLIPLLKLVRIATSY
ncbi:hypothetical protein PTTG_26893 [Puccinia triticina 1-1 BBBD Race 1]|uniref:Uncharacterized protein n=2 Tax=Puccinia triticina TaxID=208348 RepID=A0A180GQ51_PUCT1|nr:uncharacterized protein PtA15_7A463 [Puccinia triticina]OAV94825.1 hypothetical protein PTTG_26893 [Puccinia triticina 1-1 BBBD Race 1]WAQ86735.1 hypothetical protein PtA15_7A463 [Puccinia triticina]WAR56604.1 hypothetical protein PtB15_7B453 [Puccinia triticina]